ncbi:phosphopantothenoylcysteine decarboxylase [Paenibacillus validus]|uniref:phosphopantothenoylcysteine decarboxylase domain-containing protein n=1 Tax=Paenibacillus validus TaxID=44253 RepID=UPI003D29F7F5
MACGYVGKGRLAEPEEIVRAIEQHFAEDGRLKGKRVLITAGATLERIDPVRYISNDSSGKMGYAIAEAAARMGADVTLVSGKVSVPVPAGRDARSGGIDTGDARCGIVPDDDQDVIIKAAAVADYRPAEQYEHKLKKTEDEMTMRLVKNPDILQLVGERKTKQLVVGFAAETRDLEKFAMDKLQRKRCDLLVANGRDAGRGRLRHRYEHRAHLRCERLGRSAADAGVSGRSHRGCSV